MPNYYNNPYMQYPYNFNQPQQQMQNNNFFAYVNGIEGAKSYQIVPNQTVLLVDNDNPYIYFKSSNQLGQSTIRYFSITEVDESKVRQTLGGTPNLPQEKYVLLSDFKGFSEKLDKLTEEFEKIKSKGNKGA